jgi:hypothetical protein
MRSEWVLPRGARALIATALLDEGCLDWGDCEVVVRLLPAASEDRAGGAERDVPELARVRLNGASPARDITCRFAPTALGDRLRIDVEQGEHGPIQDRVRLLSGLIITGD